MSALKKITKMQHRNAVRRERVGVKAPHEVYHCRSIDLGCNGFWKERGYASNGFSRRTVENKEEGTP